MIVKQFQIDKQINEWLGNQSNLDKLREDYPPSLWTAHVNLEDKCIVAEIKPTSSEPYNDVPLEWGIDEMNC